MSSWRKVGSVHSGDDKSNRSVRSRSRDEMPTMSFHQNVIKMKNTTSSQLIDSQNTYFCKNYIDRKRQTSSNKSLSRIRTQRSLTNERDDVIRSTISKKKLSKDQDAQSHGSGVQQLQRTDQPKKLKRFPKSGQLKQLKEDHYRLKQFVKYEINSFKTAFKDLSEQLKYEISYKKQAIAQKAKQEEIKKNLLVPIVPFRFDSKILDSINFYETNPKKITPKSLQADINVLHQIKTEARLCIDSLNQYQNEKTELLEKYKDINLEQLLA